MGTLGERDRNLGMLAHGSEARLSEQPAALSDDSQIPRR